MSAAPNTPWTTAQAKEELRTGETNLNSLNVLLLALLGGTARDPQFSQEFATALQQCVDDRESVRDRVPDLLELGKADHEVERLVQAYLAAGASAARISRQTVTACGAELTEKAKYFLIAFGRLWPT